MQIWVLLTDGFGGHGGIALYNRQLLGALCGHPTVQKVIAFPRITPDFTEALPASLDYRTGSGGPAIHYILTLIKAARTEERPELLICSHLNLWPIANVMASILRIPTVLVLYGVEAWSKPGFLRAANLGRASRILSISQITKDRFLTWAPVESSKVELHPNGIDLSKYGPGEKPKYLLDRYGLVGKKVLLTLGRLDARERAKGFDQVIDAMPGLLETEPDLSYLIVGDGSDLERLRQKAQGKGIGSAVIFAGRIPEDEKADHYRLADLYVMPSRWEGFGFVFLEAMACGIPVVASAIDGGRDAVRDGQLGALVDPENPEQLADAILIGLAKPKGIPKGLDYFSVANFDRRMHSLVDALIVKSGS